jgi:hypothetical protein
MMDEDWVYRESLARRVPFTNHRPPREQLLNGQARRRFPTGVVFTCEPRDFPEACATVRSFQR